MRIPWPPSRGSGHDGSPNASSTVPQAQVPGLLGCPNHWRILILLAWLRPIESVRLPGFHLEGHERAPTPNAAPRTIDSNLSANAVRDSPLLFLSVDWILQ